MGRGPQVSNYWLPKVKRQRVCASCGGKISRDARLCQRCHRKLVEHQWVKFLRSLAPKESVTKFRPGDWAKVRGKEAYRSLAGSIVRIKRTVKRPDGKILYECMGWAFRGPRFFSAEQLDKIEEDDDTSAS